MRTDSSTPTPDFDAIAESISPKQLANAIGAEQISAGSYRCPLKSNHSHQDKNPSFSIFRKENRTSAKCHACDLSGSPVSVAGQVWGVDPREAAKRLVESVGLNVADKNINGNRKEVAAYDYQDEQGSLLFQTVRYEPKTFRQRRPNDQGGYIWNLHGVRLVPYRLPDFLDKQTVYVVEGEADANALWEWGLPATTNPMGAGKWRPEYNRYFEGKQVVVLPDHDEVGESHMREVASSLFPTAKAVKIVRLPGLQEKGDFSDWKRNGGSLEKLSEIVTCTLPLTQEGVELFSETLPSPDNKRTSSIAEILTKAGFGELIEDSPGDDIERVIRNLGHQLEGADQVRRMATRGEAMRLFSKLKIKGATGILDAVLRVQDTQPGKGVMEEQELEPWPEVVNGAELLDDISSWIGGYVFAPKESIDAIALWSVATWFVEFTYFAPILTLLSPTKQSGKTLIIDLLEWICRETVRTSGVGITPAVIFRLNEKRQPTFLIDEAEKLSGQNANMEIIGLLNEGYRRGGKVQRCGDKSTNFEVEEFDAFGFRLLASTRNLWDTLIDRSIIIPIKRKPRNEKMRRFIGREVKKEGLVLARRVLRFAQDNKDEYEPLQITTPRPQWLPDRGCDNWSPLFAVAQLAGDDWMKRALASAKALNNAAEDGDRAEKLIHDTYRIFKDQGWPEVIKSGALVEALNLIESSPWGDYSQGKGITTTKVATVFRAFGVRPDQRRDRTSEKIRGYWLKDLEDTFKRYIPPPNLGHPGQTNSDGGSSGFQGGTEKEPCPRLESAETRTTTELSRVSQVEGRKEQKRTENTPKSRGDMDL